VGGALAASASLKALIPSPSLIASAARDGDARRVRPSWSAEDTSLKHGWPDKNGKIARGGELPTSAIPQAVLLAAKHDYLTREDMARIAHGLIDVLAGIG
jgi:hypothetical protein